MTVTLTIATGSNKGTQQVLSGSGQHLVGRGKDCEFQLPCSPEYQRVSRRHCLLEINPSEARIRDLESRNGTFVNGVAIGDAGVRMEQIDGQGMIWRRLKTGDEIRLGNVYLRVALGVTSATDDMTLIDSKG